MKLKTKILCKFLGWHSPKFIKVARLKVLKTKCAFNLL